MNTNRSTKSKISTRLPLIALIFGLGIISIIISCETEDDIPPPSAYVEPEPLPVVEGCPEDPIVNDISIGLDFECGGPEISFFGEKDGSFTLEYVDNPVASGINTSEKVVEFIQTAGVEPWAGMFFDLSGKVDFSENQAIKLKVYSPAAEQTILIKLEDSGDGSINKEVMGTTTVANEWEELTFNFSTSDSDKYDRLVLFFNFNGEKDAPTTHYFDDIILGEAGEIIPPVEAEEPTTAAPAPILPESDVISVYSDSYTPTTVSELPTEWSGSGFEEIQIEGNNTIKYSDLDFTGIVTDYGNPTDLTAKAFVHFDYWTADGTELGIKLVNTAVDPAQEDLESFGTVIQGQWVSVDIALDDFAMDRSQVTQILFDNLVAGADITLYIDNLYFHNGQPTGPTSAAPTPTVAEADVISIYSDSYTPTTVSELPTEWSGSGFEEIQIEGNNTIKYSDLDFTGIVTDYGNPTDLTAMTHVHVDYWTADGTELGIKLVNTAVDPVQEDLESFGTVTQGQWVSVDIALDDFAMDKSQVTQILLDNLVAGDANITVYIDNLFFYALNESSIEPTGAAPTPTVAEADVISIYSDAYTPTTVSELPTEWSGSGFEEIQIEGNNTIKYSDLDFTGIVTDYGNPTDLTAMTHVHVDYWTADGTELGIKLVNTAVDPVQEDLESFGTVTQGQWVSVDIALDDFAMDRSQVTQILFDNLVAGDASITVYIDNLYFYR
ncbi:carbohydrate binding domain-containing protein [Maribacter arenosus]|uniref:Carbohydrate binding domain-containing protein n=1 Tax=Maribacter arenosus TaxID=1854708 RepID=A0ABR7V8J1_9FLAO|nr:carbohydrate binding domain-containing protein [Maribacter arenosus]MBD0849994.1 carbohydrate binding domain-containing protein [Maribacter arenosus]